MATIPNLFCFKDIFKVRNNVGLNWKVSLVGSNFRCHLTSSTRVATAQISLPSLYRVRFYIFLQFDLSLQPMNT